MISLAEFNALVWFFNIIIGSTLFAEYYGFLLRNAHKTKQK